jgi:hypothetical protein
MVKKLVKCAKLTDPNLADPYATNSSYPMSDASCRVNQKLQ